jgi:predicted amidophosphoribosyltransferase
MTCKCPSCGGAINYREQDAGTIEACPHCSARLTFPASGTNVATRQAIRRGGALWALLKVVGLLILIASFVWLLLLVSTILMSNATTNAWAVAAFASLPAVLGMVGGYVLFTLARKAGVQFVCSNCEKPIRKNASVCAGCGAAISD